MADNKTVPTNESVEAFLGSVSDERRRRDCHELLKLMKQITGEKPVMWGSSIVGFGSYRYRYAGGRAGDWLVTGFSPRKQNLTLYIMDGFDRHHGLLKKLGKHKLGKCCLYLNSLSDIDVNTLKKLIEQSVRQVRSQSA